MTPYYNDPFAIVWDALAHGGYKPHGPLHSHRARCPEHGGDNPDSLHVWDRGDGAVWFTCFAHHCPTEAIIERLGLRWADLFPVDYHGSGKRLPVARRPDFTGHAQDVANVLLAAMRLGERWSGCLWLDECPNCEWPHFLLSASAEREPRVYCPRGCDVPMAMQALANRVSTHRRAA